MERMWPSEGNSPLETEDGTEGGYVRTQKESDLVRLTHKLGNAEQRSHRDGFVGAPDLSQARDSGVYK
jgi:hypothetical protein